MSDDVLILKQMLLVRADDIFSPKSYWLLEKEAEQVFQFKFKTTQTTQINNTPDLLQVFRAAGFTC